MKDKLFTLTDFFWNLILKWYIKNSHIIKMFVLVINRDISFQVWESKECLIQIQKIIL